MAQVNAVEVADGEDAAAFAGAVKLAEFFRAVENDQSSRRIRNLQRERAGRGFGGDLELKSIVSQLNIGLSLPTETFVRFRVSQVVRDVREPGAFWFELGDEIERLLDGLVHGMGRIAQGVEHQVVQV